ncbi:hypothetical protein [Celeribacter sp. PS-C1]|nr:hypothetical protein [Celeribacter sp. PS-C1]
MIVQELLTEIFGQAACFSGSQVASAREKGGERGILDEFFS